MRHTGRGSQWEERCKGSRAGEYQAVSQDASHYATLPEERKTAAFMTLYACSFPL